MRAIEKNILVVSTREPGPITRRGETGDGMVNGSVEEDAASVTQQPPPPSPSQPSSQPSSQTTQSQPAQPVQPTSQDVEMEYWEKDCSSTVTISVHTVENEQPLMHSSVIPASDSTLTKNLFTEETAREKLEQVTSRTDISATNYITTVSDFSTISNLNLQPHGPEAIATAVPVVQSLPAVGAVSEDSMVPSTDIAVAIINEDTNSQPNLDMENEEIEASTAIASTTTSTTTTTTMTTATATTTTMTSATSTTSVSTAATTTVTVVATVIPLTTDTTRKLQAAFQAKRFESSDKSVDKSNEKTTDSSKLVSVEEEIGQSLKDEETTKSSPERIDPNEMPRDESRLTESLLQTDVEMKSDALTDDTESVEETARDKPKEELSILEDLDEGNLRSTSSQNTNATALVESQSMEKDSTVPSNECVSAVIVSSTEALYKIEKSEIHSKEESETISSTECFARDQSISQKTESVEETDKVLKAIPTTASSSSNTNGQEEQESDNNDNLNIMEISNDKMILVESMTPDPISVEKSKEATSVIEKLDPVSPTVETIESSDNVSCRSPKDDKLTGDQDDNVANSQGNKTTAGITIKGNQSSVIENIACRKESEELMEIDDEESLSTFQQDEPMEQEAMEELPKS